MPHSPLPPRRVKSYLRHARLNLTVALLSIVFAVWEAASSPPPSAFAAYVGVVVAAGVLWLAGKR